MLKADVIAHYGSQVAVARALGLTKSAVNQWGTLVPLDKAVLVQADTGSKLKVNLSMYEGTPEKALVDFGRSSRRHVTA